MERSGSYRPPCRKCHSRACFTTARQWRGCGNCAPPASATGSGGAQFPRKTTRGCLLWTPRRIGKPTGGTGVAAKAVSRVCRPRLPLPLHSTPDEVLTTPVPAARGQQSGQRRVVLTSSVSTRFLAGSKAHSLRCSSSQNQSGCFDFGKEDGGSGCIAFTALTVTVEAVRNELRLTPRRVLSFRQDEKKEWGAHCAVHVLRTGKTSYVNQKRKRDAVGVPLQTVDKPIQSKSDSHGESARGDGNPLSRYNLCKNGNFFGSSHFCFASCRHVVDSLKRDAVGVPLMLCCCFISFSSDCAG